MKILDSARIGHSFSKQSRYGQLRFWFLTVATFATILSIFLMTVTNASYSGRELRSENRSVVYSQHTPGFVEAFRHQIISSSVNEHQSVLVVYLEPLIEDAPLPPGLDSWPAPGTSIISPALEAYVASDNLAQRYGEIAGYIDITGLTDAGELLIYARPASGVLTDETADMGSHFGAGFSFGQTSYDQPLGAFLAMQGLLSILPALSALITATKLGAGARARRTTILSKLGISRAKMQIVHLAEASGPLLAGLGMAVAVACVFFVTDVQVPITGFNILASDVQRHATLGITAILGALLLVSIIIVWGSAAFSEKRKPFNSPTTVSYFGAIAAPALALTTVIFMNLHYVEAFRSLGSELNGLIFTVGVIITLIFLPHSVTQWVYITSTLIRRYAWRQGNPGLLAGSAQTAARPRPASLFSYVTAMIIIVLSIAYTMISTLDRSAAEALEFQNQTGQRIAQLESTAGPEAMAAIASKLPDSYGAIQFRAQTETNTSSLLTIHGDSRSLATFGLREGKYTDQQLFSDPAMQSVHPWLNYLAVSQNYRAVIISTTQSLPTISVMEDPDNTSHVFDLLLVSSHDGQSIHLPTLNAELAAAFPNHILEAEFPGQDFLLGGMVDHEHAQWLWMFGVVGTAFILAGLWANYANELLRVKRQLGPVQVLAPTGSFATNTIATRILVPVSVAIVGGSSIAAVLTAPHSALTTGEIVIPWGLICSLAAVTGFSALIGWAVTSRSAVNHAKMLTLGAPDE